MIALPMCWKYMNPFLIPFTFSHAAQRRKSKRDQIEVISRAENGIEKNRARSGAILYWAVTT